MNRARRGLSVAVMTIGVLLVALAPAVTGTSATTGHLAPVGIALADDTSLAPTPPCPDQYTCVTMPGDSLASSGTIEAGPTTDLGPDQWVYLNAYGFAPGSDLEVNYCADTAPLPAVPICYVPPTSTNPGTGPEYSQATLVTLADGTSSFSFQTWQDETTSDTPISGQLLDSSGVDGSFYCDTEDPCSVDVTNLGTGGNDSTPTADNTAVIPVSFAPQTSGCVDTAASVTTESEYGIEQLLPEVAAVSCQAAQPSQAFNTDVDGLNALDSLSQGVVQVAFTDDPEDPAQQAVLQQGNFKLIPVALTANVIGFRATIGDESESGKLFSLSSMELTPTLAAYLTSGLVSDPGPSPVTGTSQFTGTDLVSCQGDCPMPPCPTPARKKSKAASLCSMLTLLENQPGFLGPQQYGPYVRSDTAGSTGLLFSWLCKAPVVPVTLDISGTSATYKETQTGAQVLEEGLSSTGTPLSTCPDTDQFPPVTLTGTPHGYTSALDPNEQSVKMTSVVPEPGTTGNEVAAFAAMNWANALYYGLDLASLQNASGNFVQPSAQSLDAAVADAVHNPDGTISPNYATTDPAAYPMTSVIYAAVCGDPMPSDQATDITNMLSQMLEVTGGSDSDQLPVGFVPLPSSLSTQAQQDINSDIVGGGSASSSCPAPAGPASGTPSGSSTASSSSSSSSSKPVGNGPTVANPTFPKPEALNFGSGALNPGTPGVGLGISLLVGATDAAAFAPAALGLGGATVLFGGALLVSPARRRALARHLARAASALGVGRRLARTSGGRAGEWFLGGWAPMAQRVRPGASATGLGRLTRRWRARTENW